MLAEIRLEFDAETKKRLDAFLEELASKAENMPAALKNIGEALLQTTDARFERGQDADGKAWAPLSPLTKEIRGSSGPILWRTGRLKSSVSYNVTGNVLKLGPNTIDAAAHQFGAVIVPKDKKALRIPIGKGAVFTKKITIPARPFIGFGKEDKAAAEDALLDWLDLREIS